MPSSSLTPGSAFGSATTDNSSINPRVIAAGVAVVGIHIGLLAIALTMRNEPPPRPVESKTITAEL
ncbi:energy transducer TonB, partial [Caballeronia sp. M23-90]